MNESRTRRALLAAARRHFSRKGYRGTSIREVTGSAGANLGAVTYHFGSKEGLYHAVLETMFAPLAATLAGVESAPGRPLDRIETLVGLFAEHLERRTQQVGLIRHELALERSLPRPIRAWLDTLYAGLERMIRAGQAEGSIVPGEPRLLAAAVLAQPFYLAMARKALIQGAGLPLGPGAEDRALVHDHVRSTVRRVLASGRRST